LDRSLHSVLGDLLDATLRKFEARLGVPIQTPPMHATGRRFADRMQVETAGVRATVLRGRALLIDAAREAPVAIRVGATPMVVPVSPGVTACVPLDAARQGCTPVPSRDGGPGAPTEVVTARCDSSSAGDPGSPGHDHGGDRLGCRAAPKPGAPLVAAVVALWMLLRTSTRRR
jgi:hypothetical protein